MKIETPCVNICKLDERGICIGCFRSVQEIAAWSRMSDAERSAIMTALAGRTNCAIERSMGSHCEQTTK